MNESINQSVSQSVSQSFTVSVKEMAHLISTGKKPPQETGEHLSDDVKTLDFAMKELGAIYKPDTDKVDSLMALRNLSMGTSCIAVAQPERIHFYAHTGKHLKQSH